MLLMELVRNRFVERILLFVLAFCAGLLVLGSSFVVGDTMRAPAKPYTETKLRLFKPEARPAAESAASLEERSASEESANEATESLATMEVTGMTEAPSHGYYAPAVPDGFVYSESIPLSYELQGYTYAKCVERGLAYETVLALMWRESRFQLDAVNINANGTQDSGVMQINDVNRQFLLENYGIVDLMDPVQNIDAGTILLSMYQRKYGEHGALMAYQYGESGLEEKRGDGVETNDLVELLYERREHYRALLRS